MNFRLHVARLILAILIRSSQKTREETFDVARQRD